MAGEGPRGAKAVCYPKLSDFKIWNGSLNLHLNMTCEQETPVWNFYNKNCDKL